MKSLVGSVILVIAAYAVSGCAPPATNGEFVLPESAEELGLAPANGEIVYLGDSVVVAGPVEIHGSLASLYQRNRVRITLSESAYVNLYVDGHGELDPMLALFDNNQRFVESDDDTRRHNPYIGRELEAGDYEVEIASFLWDELRAGLFPYTLHIWTGEPVEEAPTRSFGR